MNVDLYHSDVGSGPTLVLLHGFCESSALWEGILPQLAAKYRTIVIDLPGFGLSDLMDVESIEMTADLVHHFLYEQGVKSYHVMGHSLGGYIALALVERFEESILSLGLINSNAFADSKEKKEKRNQTIAFVQKHGAEAFLRSFTPSLFSSSHRVNMRGAVDRLLSITLGTQEKSLIAYTQAMRERKDRSKQLCIVPVFFLAGQEDELIPESLSLQHQSLIPPNQFHILADCGHVAMLEQPELLVEKILAFLGKQEA